ncbi:MAG: Rrf2 family transcriptional regulator [Chloroflexi bacterium]|nr:Rrf2 family transcriptional regulator [Chloroflexota bacterium]
MQITRQADYAIRAILFLTENDPNLRASTSQIAEQKHIPPSFLAKIISQLSIAGLIHTSRGARGGVSLARPADQISVMEVVEAIDGPIALNQCTFSSLETCPFGDNCPVREMWMDAQCHLVEKLKNTTFNDFIKR